MTDDVKANAAKVLALDKDAAPGPWSVIGNTLYIDPDGVHDIRFWALPGDIKTAQLIAAYRTIAPELARVVLAQAAEIGRLRAALETVGEAVPKWAENVGSFAGGETWCSFSQRLQNAARAALAPA